MSRKGRGRERARERPNMSWVYREQEGAHAPLSWPRLDRATQESKQMYRGWASLNTVSLPTPYSAGRSQESGHPLPSSNALMDMFATHSVSVNLGKILLYALTESEIASAMTAVSNELGPSSSTEMPHTGCSCLHPPPVCLSIYIFLNWRTIALQCCGALCHTSMLISHNDTYRHIDIYIYIYIYI